MRLTAIILLTATLHVSATGFSQNVTISSRKITLKKVFELVKQQTGVSFLWNERELDKYHTVSIDVKDVPLTTVLDICLHGLSLSYKIRDKVVLIEPIPAQNSRGVPYPPEPPPPHAVKGHISNEKGEPLSGVSISVKGTNRGASTNEKGEFTIAVAKGDVLVFSFVGYASREVVIDTQTDLNVSLQQAIRESDQVVVVGYATQIKANMTAAVSQVSGEELTKNPAPDAANLLEGKVAGLDIVQPTAQPGGDQPAISIRGIANFGAANTVLVLIDGVPGDFTLISPNDIASITVLKDAASTAVYGSLAGNGVILVTTKKGRSGNFNITYHDNVAVNEATRLPKLVYNSAQYLTMFNQASEHSGLPDLYSPAQIAAYRDAPANSKQYPNFNWIDFMFKNAHTQNHNLNFSGGNDKTTYNVSLDYLTQDGIINNNDYHRYNMLSNLESRINKTFKIGSSVGLTYGNQVTPTYFTNDNLVLLIYSAAPTYMPYLPDGSGRYANTAYPGDGNNWNPLQRVNQGTLKTGTYNGRAQIYTETNLAKGLTWLVKGAVNYTNSTQKTHYLGGAAYNYQPDSSGNYTVWSADNRTIVTDYTDINTLLTGYSTLNYHYSFPSGHTINILAGTEVDSYNDQNLTGTRNVFPSPLITQLNGGGTTNQSLGGDGSAWATRSYFDRVNYDFRNKYLLELSSAYMGSSRISPGHRYGFFPAISGGWKISEEEFMKRASESLFLKIRGSWGQTGNQLIGTYPYQNVAGVVSYPFGGTLQQGTLQQNLVDQDLHWETISTTDFGIDANIKNGLLTITADYFNKKTSGILTKPNIPESIGLGSPTTNYGEMQDRGFELELGHRQSIGKDFRYSVNVLFYFDRNKLLQIDQPQISSTNISKTGLPYNSYYLVKWTGIFQSQDDIAKSPTQPYSPKPGDLKFQDANGDGKIDASDQVVVKGVYPAYTYSFNLNLSYKRFDFTAFFQGVQGVKHYVNGWGAEPFLQGSPPPVAFEGAWTAQNHSQTIPALYIQGYSAVDGTSSTYFLQNASYLRLKNAQISYNLPAAVLSRAGIKALAIYLSGANLFTVTKYKGADPERAGDGRFAQYPQVRIISGGINLKF